MDVLMEAPNTHAHLFTLRIWLVNEESPALEWRGRVQNLHSGEVNYCANWDSLIACIEETLRDQKDVSISD